MNAAIAEAPGSTAAVESVVHHQPLTQELFKLVEHSVWANSKWVEFVYSRQNPEARPRELLGHLVVGALIWFERVEGQQKTTTFFPVMEKDDLIRGFAQNAETFRRLITTRLNDDIHFRRSTGVEYHTRVIDIVHHLLTHEYHHRGQLALHYAGSGLKYPDTDHINFLFEKKL